MDEFQIEDDYLDDPFSRASNNQPLPVANEQPARNHLGNTSDDDEDLNFGTDLDNYDDEMKVLERKAACPPLNHLLIDPRKEVESRMGLNRDHN